jgi:hypothetical protein
MGEQSLTIEPHRELYMGSGFAGLIAVVAIMVVAFLICRAIVLWYWRVNEGIALLKSIDEKLGQMAASGVAIQSQPAARVAPAARATGTR